MTEANDTITVRIKRRRSSEAKPYWQEFEYRVRDRQRETAASVLEALNFTDDLFDIKGEAAPRIIWDCSCLQGICGSCGMVINDRPSLACKYFLRDMEGDCLELRPLTKFPVVRDLKVDRSVIQESLFKAETYLEQYGKEKEADHELRYALAKCTKCGLCLEVCPNYKAGKDFFGGMFAGESFLLYSVAGEEKKSVKKEYNRHFAAGCSKALSCESICPNNLPSLAAMARMNKI